MSALVDMNICAPGVKKSPKWPTERISPLCRDSRWCVAVILPSLGSDWLHPQVGRRPVICSRARHQNAASVIRLSQHKPLRDHLWNYKCVN